MCGIIGLLVKEESLRPRVGEFILPMLIGMTDREPDAAETDDHKLSTAPGFCHHCQTGRCPVGVTTQDPILEQRLEPVIGARRIRNYLKTLSMELTMIARACGKQDVHHLEREDLVALTIEAAAMAGVPLAGTAWIPGRTVAP
jgi:methylamine---glutamate N-methyltransferase subunit C